MMKLGMLMVELLVAAARKSGRHLIGRTHSFEEC
jgi:hypothetical protein